MPFEIIIEWGSVAPAVIGALITPLILLFVVWLRDNRGNEKLTKILLTFIFGATASAVASILLEAVIVLGLNVFLKRDQILLLLGVLIAPVVEESMKGLGVLWRRSLFDEVGDGIVYGSVCGFGFSASENFLYGYNAIVSQGLFFFTVLIVFRSITATLIHGTTTGVLGYGLSGKRHGKFSSRFSWLFIFGAVCIHMFYNFLAGFSGITAEITMILILVFTFSSFGVILIFAKSNEAAGKSLILLESKYKDVTVQIKLGDITLENTDAIVNPVNSELKMQEGTAATIKSKGGSIIENSAKMQGSVPIGSAIITVAGNLPTKYVIHSSTIEKPGAKTNNEAVLNATRAALTVAKNHNLTSIAFPGMGTGVGKASKLDVAHLMINAIKEHIDSGTSLKKIVLVGYDKKMSRAFAVESIHLS
jgi:O-acetyl-ADP-ribose deacetylase (regulator of RNase III)/RsiW-degrading membrane proteinase PrsW (M82 family)